MHGRAYRERIAPGAPNYGARRWRTVQTRAAREYLRERAYIVRIVFLTTEVTYRGRWRHDLAAFYADFDRARAHLPPIVAEREAVALAFEAEAKHGRGVAFLRKQGLSLDDLMPTQRYRD